MTKNDNPKPPPREWWLNLVTGKFYKTSELPNSIIHVIERSYATELEEKLTEAYARIKELEDSRPNVGSWSGGR